MYFVLSNCDDKSTQFGTNRSWNPPIELMNCYCVLVVLLLFLLSWRPLSLIVWSMTFVVWLIYGKVATQYTLSLKMSYQRIKWLKYLIFAPHHSHLSLSLVSLDALHKQQTKSTNSIELLHNRKILLVRQKQINIYRLICDRALYELSTKYQYSIVINFICVRVYALQ